MKIQKIIARVLLSFVLISIGFALGRETARRSMKPDKTTSAVTKETAQGDKVVVYYLYGPIRCVTCNKIEATAKEVVETTFTKELAEGRLEWKTGSFLEDEDLAQRYNIAASSLVVIKTQGGRDVTFETLEEVWTLVDNKPAFVDYVQKAVKSYLEGEQE